MPKTKKKNVKKELKKVQSGKKKTEKKEVELLKGNLIEAAKSINEKKGQNFFKIGSKGSKTFILLNNAEEVKKEFKSKKKLSPQFFKKMYEKKPFYGNDTIKAIRFILETKLKINLEKYNEVKEVSDLNKNRWKSYALEVKK